MKPLCILFTLSLGCTQSLFLIDDNANGSDIGTDFHQSDTSSTEGESSVYSDSVSSLDSLDASTDSFPYVQSDALDTYSADDSDTMESESIIKDSVADTIEDVKKDTCSPIGGTCVYNWDCCSGLYCYGSSPGECKKLP